MVMSWWCYDGDDEDGGGGDEEEDGVDEATVVTATFMPLEQWPVMEQM